MTNRVKGLNQMGGKTLSRRGLIVQFPKTKLTDSRIRILKCVPLQANGGLFPLMTRTTSYVRILLIQSIQFCHYFHLWRQAHHERYERGCFKRLYCHFRATSNGCKYTRNKLSKRQSIASLRFALAANKRCQSPAHLLRVNR